MRLASTALLVVICACAPTGDPNYFPMPMHGRKAPWKIRQYEAAELAGFFATTDYGALRSLTVAPDGSDGNDGSAARPLRTIQKALDRATAATIIRVKAGIYREHLEIKTLASKEGPLVLFSEDGKAAAKIDGGEQERTIVDIHGQHVV